MGELFAEVSGKSKFIGCLFFSEAFQQEDAAGKTIALVECVL